jgi:hypothetical protein
MAERQRFTKEPDLILRVDTLFLLRKLIEPSFIDITSLNFFKLITSKYIIFKQRQIRFPALVFLLSRNLPNYQSLLLNYENLTLLPLNIDFYLSHNFLFNSNLLSLISSTITKDLARKEKSQYGAVPYKCLIKSDSLSLNSGTHFSKYKSESAIKNQSIVFNNQVITENRAEEEKDIYKIFPRIRTQFIFLKTSNMPITSKIINPAMSSSGTISGFLGLHHESHDKVYQSSKNKSWSDEGKPLDEKSSNMVLSKDELFQSFPSKHVSSDSDLRSQKSDIKAEKHRPILAFKKTTIRSNGYLDSDISTPNLIYLNPQRAELEDLKKTVSGIEKKEADGESSTGAMKSDKSHFNQKESDSLHNKSNIKAGKHRPILTFKKTTIRSSDYLDSDISTPNLLYLNPQRAELEDLKKTVSGIEKKEAEGESSTGTMKSDMKSDKSHFNQKESDNLHNKTTINLNYLADQVYQMLERKINVEKERRGL